MIINERIEINGVKLCKQYSDRGKYIIQIETGNKYAEAIDISPCPYIYAESDKDIEQMEENNGKEIFKNG